MDIFIEHIVKKRRDAKSTAITVLAVLAGLVSVFVVLRLVFGMFVAAAVIYGVYWVITSQNLEFEYSITNNCLDVDKITAKRSRKRMLSLEISQIESMAPANGNTFAHIMRSGEMKIHKFCSSTSSSGLYYAIFDSGGGREVLLFEPTEKMLGAIKRYIGSKLQTC